MVVSQNIGDPYIDPKMGWGSQNGTPNFVIILVLGSFKPHVWASGFRLCRV